MLMDDVVEELGEVLANENTLSTVHGSGGASERPKLHGWADHPTDGDPLTC